MRCIIEWIKGHSYLFSFLFFTAFWYSLLLLNGTLFAGFHFTDDHQILSIASKLPESGFLDTLQGMIKEDLRIGRFRPFYNLHRLLEIGIFGTDLARWAVYNGLLASLTSLFMFAFMRAVGFSVIASLVFPLFSLVGTHSGIWWRLGPAETIGMVNLSLALMYTGLAVKTRSRLNGLISVLFMLLMSLSKETFILIIPALVYIKLWRDKKSGWAEAVGRNLHYIIPSMAVFTGLLLFIKYFVGTAGVGYAGYGGFDVFRFLSAFLRLAIFGHVWIILIGLALAAVMFVKKEASLSSLAEFAAPLVLLSLITIPQALIYAKSGISERYLFPGILAYAFFLSYLLNFLGRNTEDGAAERGIRPALASVFGWIAIVGLLFAEQIFLNHRMFKVVFDSEALRYLSDIRAVPPASFFMARLNESIRSTWFFPIALGFFSGLVFLSAGLARPVIKKMLSRYSFYQLLLAAAVIFNLTVCFDRAYTFSFECRNIQDWMRSIEENTAEDGMVLVVADPIRNSEWGMSIKAYLNHKAGRNNLYIYPLKGDGATRNEASPFESFSLVYGDKSVDNVHDKQEIGAVAIFPGLEEKFLQGSSGWFDPSAFERYFNEFGFVSYYRRK